MPTPRHDIVVVGASAGGVEALLELVRGLPADLPAAIFVVLHVPSARTSHLPSILGRATAMPVAHAADGMAIAPGSIYIAPPDRHLLIRYGTIHLQHGPRENGHRPAIDPLFRSAARVYGPRVIGVILTGAQDDGTQGLMAIKDRGGLAVVQDPRTAAFPGMPESALAGVDVDHRVPLSEMSRVLARLVRQGVEQEPAQVAAKSAARQLDVVEPRGQDEGAEEALPGTPSVYTCPECHGVLWDTGNGQLGHFRCRVGHAYSLGTLYAAQTESVESALWVALRSFEERESLARRMEERAMQQQHHRAAATFRKQAEDTAHHAETLRSVLLTGGAVLDPAADLEGA